MVTRLGHDGLLQIYWPKSAIAIGAVLPQESTWVLLMSRANLGLAGKQQHGPSRCRTSKAIAELACTSITIMHEDHLENEAVCDGQGAIHEDQCARNARM